MWLLLEKLPEVIANERLLLALAGMPPLTRLNAVTLGGMEPRPEN
ncbi:hypothetical protein [Thalassovita taeanensis]|uniref:Uncharacterized protein n=1 Tax=Thalassovita taeanensis TaxID=657014 RepID=A0A1H9ES78_9RHOB|nr:hypothetical protein [Thalassovita taeanensis]SEQ27858.1 hypothetical protein SAMN04488092_105133 [Thalassovita taeanensis]